MEGLTLQQCVLSQAKCKLRGSSSLFIVLLQYTNDALMLLLLHKTQETVRQKLTRVPPTKFN